MVEYDISWEVSNYATSPALVQICGETSGFKKIVKPILNRFVAYLKRKGYSELPYKD